MLGESGTLIFITFFLGVTGYLGLTIVIILSLQEYFPSIIWKITTLIILAHVIMIWLFRYDLHFPLAVRNSYSGFAIFHSALILILLSHFYKRKSLLLIRLSFIIVSMGAIGAVFRYDVVELYKVPVLTCAITGCCGLIWKSLKLKQRVIN